MSVMSSPGDPPYSSEAYQAYTRWWKGNQEVKNAAIAAEEAARAGENAQTQAAADDLPPPISPDYSPWPLWPGAFCLYRAFPGCP
jgi:hypothetical protein